MSESSDSTNILSATRQNKIRATKDKLARYGVAVGGVAVIIAVLLIFVYLLYVVVPLFFGADVHKKEGVNFENLQNALLLSVEEQNEVAFALKPDGAMSFTHLQDHQTVKTVDNPLPGKVLLAIEAVSAPDWFAMAYSSGDILIAKQAYKPFFSDQGRDIIPDIEFPFGEDGFSLADVPVNPLALSFSITEEEGAVVLLAGDGLIRFAQLSFVENMMTDELELEISNFQLPLQYQAAEIQSIQVSLNGRWLYVMKHDGRIDFWNIGLGAQAKLVQTLDLDSPITTSKMLLGGVSLLVGLKNGHIHQLFPVRDADNQYSLEQIRHFDEQNAAIQVIYPEQRRKGFVALDESGYVVFYHSTAHRVVARESLNITSAQTITLSPRGNGLYLLDASGNLSQWSIENEHPEVSFQSLWGKVWYEGYDESKWIWQSSASNNDFEPKFSLTPLAYGTLKGAFYAMLFAVPLAIMGAIFTAHFMAPKMRQTVKPAIEIMEALPTVILGFLAGLWFAPYVEKHLAGVFNLLIMLPVGVLIFAWLWRYLPARIRVIGESGWQAALLVPFLIFVILISQWLGNDIQNLFFNGDMRRWLSEDMGIGYDQRNALVVGFAMGFSVIPTIFSIAEDAIFSVPKALSSGSLALGASPWQTLVRVVLPTASPGIFSGLMIGLGRAVGETMIVLMATGNTPVMDFSMFSGMRTLSANIAVEMPESELHSTHYRVLFLAALVLFMFTFIVNTVAEIVRQRLRTKYSSL